MTTNLRDLIPSTNRIEANQARGTGKKTAFLESCYNEGGFVGAFLVKRNNVEADVETDGVFRQAGEYLRAEFHAEKEGPKYLSDLIGSLPIKGHDGGNHQNHAYALQCYAEAGRRGVEPFTNEQDYGSCVDASLAELLSAVLGIRIKILLLPEVWVSAVAWWAYALRGYCSDGWNAWGAYVALKKLGAALRKAYELEGRDAVDLTDDDRNEQLVARTWCRNGPPQFMREHTLASHPVDDSAVVEFDGGLDELCTAFANKAVLHFSGTRISGGPKPFTPGSVGPHQMPGYGCDCSEEGRRWARDVCGKTISDRNCILHLGNTWGQRLGQWSGECAPKYWPPHWPPQTPGSWICDGEWFLRNLSADMLYFPNAIKGVPGTPPTPPPDTVPKLVGTVRAEQLANVIAIRGELVLEDKHAYILVPDGLGNYKPKAKPIA